MTIYKVQIFDAQIIANLHYQELSTACKSLPVELLIYTYVSLIKYFIIVPLNFREARKLGTVYHV